MFDKHTLIQLNFIVNSSNYNYKIMSSTTSKDYASMQPREKSNGGKESPDLEMLETRFEPENSPPKTSKKRRQEILSESAAQLRDATVPQIARDHKIVKLIWLLIYIGLFITFSFSLYEIVAKYFSYPTSVEIEIVSRPRLEFPAVTVCNENPVRKSLVGRIKEYSDLLVLDDYVKNSLQAFAAGAFDELEFHTCQEG